MAAGLGFKDFVTGEVLTAADVDGYLMQGVWVFASAAARDAAVTSPQEGNFAYLKDTNVTTYYTGSAWANLDTTGMTNPMTTTGDTIYSSSGSTPARLGIGSSGQVLSVSGGVPAWTTLSVASGLTVVKAGTTFSNVANTGTTFDSVFSSTYDSYMVVINTISAATDTDDLILTYLTSGTEISTSYFGGRIGINYGGSTLDAGVNSGTFATLSVCSGESGYEASAVLYFNNVGGRMNFHGTLHTGENEDGLGLVSFTNFNSNVYTGFRLKSASSNITGKVTVYGLAKS